METKQLLDELTRITLHNIKVVNSFKNLDIPTLNRRSSATSWSILECIEHLNRYGDFYIPELNYRIANARYAEPTQQYKQGLLGGYFARMMKAENPTKIKSLKSYNPIGSKLNDQVLDIFISQQEALLLCLDKARSINLIKNKTAISISKLIRLQLGDTFSFLIYHNERHIKQAQRVHS